MKKRSLEAANALVQGAEQISGLVGPALAAAAAASLGLGATFASLALMFLATSAVVFTVARGNAKPPAAAGPSVGDAVPATTMPPSALDGGILDGLRYAWGDPLIRTMLFVLAALNLAAIGPMIVGGAVLAEGRFGGAGALGVLFSAFGGGSLVGLLVAGAFGRPRRRGATMLGATGLLGLGLGSLGFVPGLLSACAAAGVMGVGAGYLGVVLVSWLQESVEPALRGRVMSLVMFCVGALSGTVRRFD